MAGHAGMWVTDNQMATGQSTAVKEQGVHHTSKVEQVG